MGQVEEGPGHPMQRVHLRVRHAMARDHEEADLAAGGIALGGDARLVPAPAGEKGRDIDYRDRRLSPRLSPRLSHRLPSAMPAFAARS